MWSKKLIENGEPITRNNKIILTFFSIDVVQEVDRIFHNTVTNITVISEIHTD